MNKRLFLMAGGGTGGHVIPAIAVARELRAMGQDVMFVGTARGAEARLVPAAGFRLETIEVGGMKGLGWMTRLISAWRLVMETLKLVVKFGEWEPCAVFSMGGYVAGPPTLAALLRALPLVVMEPNAMPGATNRWVGNWVTRALIGFEESRGHFPEKLTEMTGLPVREEFFALPPKQNDGVFTVLITGGSQGSQRLNNAAREAWPLIRQALLPVRLIHQSGTAMADELVSGFAATGLAGGVTAFLSDMPAAFAQADLVICRSGAGAVSELAAAGKAAVLVPYPFAADDHQAKNAESFVRVGAARMVADAEWTGQRFFEVLREFAGDRTALNRMGAAARTLAKPGAARRAAEILMEVGRKSD